MGTSIVLTCPCKAPSPLRFTACQNSHHLGTKCSNTGAYGDIAHSTTTQLGLLNTARASEHSSLSSGAQVCLSLESAAWCFPWFTPYCIHMVYEVKLHWSDSCWSTFGRCGIQSMLASFFKKRTTKNFSSQFTRFLSSRFLL